MLTLDLTVVADPACSTSRAYLTYLRAHGYRAAKVLLVDFVPLTPGIERMRRLLGSRLAFLLTQGRRATSIARSALFWQLCDEMQQGVDIRVDYFQPFAYGDYAAQIERCSTTGYADPVFQALLRRQPGALLYTCGDRVPPALAEDPSMRILHIHPGVVPAMRGSDGLLWSLAVRGKPGASCFYMDSGIDTGPLIASREFPVPRFPDLAGLLEQDEATLYGALLYSYDPHLRAQTLIDVLRAYPGISLRDLPSVPQPPGEGRAWYWMHPRLRRKVFAERILC